MTYEGPSVNEDYGNAETWTFPRCITLVDASVKKFVEFGFGDDDAVCLKCVRESRPRCADEWERAPDTAT